METAIATEPTSMNGKTANPPLRLEEKLEEVRVYWNEHIHDLELAKHPVGTLGFFDDLDEYRFDKLNYLPKLVDFKNGYKGKKILEIGCGVGIDLARFAAGGAKVTGVDLSDTAIDLARKNFSERGLEGNFLPMNGEDLDFPADSFDVVYVHGVLQYTADPHQMAREMKRVLKPGGEAISMVYNRISWLNALSKVMKVDLEHEDAPVLEKYTAAELRDILSPFDETQIIPERFPVKSRLHKGWKGAIFNGLFVPAFTVLPASIVKPLGWHLMAFSTKTL
ncbi:MAG: class I SAM-dependent methyltransferase [Calditrichaeota bacterium]|nr:MAG: class I SAM-dependent methyltransferase [Calditrichota bacterium]